MRILLFCGGLLAANLVLQWLVDEDLGFDWPHAARRNWEQFGFSALKRQIVVNPGGYSHFGPPG